MANLIAEGLGAEVLGALAGGARRALPFIIQGVGSGLSANAIAEALAEHGLGIRRANLLTLVRSYRGTFEAAQVQRGMRGNQIPPAYLFSPSATFMNNPFAYIVRVTVSNNITGAIGTMHITLSSPSALTNDQIAVYAESLIEKNVDKYKVTYLSHSLDEVLVDPRYMP